MTSTRQSDDYAYRAASELAVEANSADQARRRAARWHAWLKSPECTFQDRENFERWCSDADNAAAYIALYGDTAAAPGPSARQLDASDFDYAARAFAAAAHLPRLEAESR
jgi:ferric-dicitrate binding protein FerR (iron transport regulator)